MFNVFIYADPDSRGKNKRIRADYALQNMMHDVNERYAMHRPLKSADENGMTVLTGAVSGSPDKIISLIRTVSASYADVMFHVYLFEAGTSDPRYAANLVYVQDGGWREYAGRYRFPKLTDNLYARTEYHHKYMMRGEGDDDE